MSSNEHIQSVLAKAVTDIHYIRFLETSDETKAAFIGSPIGKKQGKNLQKIVQFAAFISKVQHNFLLKELPISYKIMHNYGLEIEIFSHYLPVYHSHKRFAGLDAKAKTNRFVEFLKPYLQEKKGRKYKILYYALLHEDSIRMLRLHAKTSTIQPLDTYFSHQSQVGVNGNLYIHHLPAPPEEIKEWVTPSSKIRFSKNKHIYMYWLRSPESQVEVITLSEEAEMVLSYINNVNTIGYILNQVKNKMEGSVASDILLFLLKNEIVYLK